METATRPKKKRKRSKEYKGQEVKEKIWKLLFFFVFGFTPPLGDSVSTVNTEIRSSDVAGSVTQQEGDSTHEVFRSTHLALRDQRGPLPVQLWVLVENLLGQRGQHVTGADAVDPDVGACPFNSERSGQVSYSSLGGIVRSLRLGNIDNSTGHTTDHDNAARSLALHQMFRNASCKEVCSIHVDAPELLDTVVRVGDGVKIFGETSGSDQVVNLAVLLDDIGEDIVHRIGVGHVGVVSGDPGESVAIISAV